jgi:ATP-dependent RNA helicase SUPV3L1/SUV3
MAELIAERLKPLVEIDGAQDIAGLARGIAFRLKENFGVLQREAIAEEIRSLDQPARSQLRKYGVRFGAFNIYFPIMLKPASAELATILWVLKRGAEHGLDAAIPELPRAGLTSLAVPATAPGAFYRVAGFHVCGPRAVRVDMLERLADLIRPLLTWRLDAADPSPPPKGATGDGGFKATPDMMSILGCSADELGHVLKALGFWAERRLAAPGASEPPSANPVVETSAPANGAPAAAGDAPNGTEEAPANIPPEETPQQPVEAATATVSDAPPPLATEPAEEKWEEVWRPRRKGRAFDRPEREKREHRSRHKDSVHGLEGQRPAQDPAPKPARHEGKGPLRRRDHRRKGPHPRDERPRPHPQASPSAPKPAFDPDSPFAALSSLKAALEKRSQD